MQNKKYYSLLLVAFVALSVFQTVHGQEWSLNPGVFYNGKVMPQYVNGVGLVVGLGYMPSEKHVFSVEFRTKYGFYNFDDGTKWSTDENGYSIPPVNPNEARLEYKLFSPQVSLVPKLYLRFNKPVSLFLEGEHGVGLMTGRFLFKGFDDKKRITETFFSYGAGLGVEYDVDDLVINVSIGYSTLNFKDKIKKNVPTDYHEFMPNQNAPVYLNIMFKIPIGGW